MRSYFCLRFSLALIKKKKRKRKNRTNLTRSHCLRRELTCTSLNQPGGELLKPLEQAKKKKRYKRFVNRKGEQKEALRSKLVCACNGVLKKKKETQSQSKKGSTPTTWKHTRCAMHGTQILLIYEKLKSACSTPGPVSTQYWGENPTAQKASPLVALFC